MNTEKYKNKFIEWNKEKEFNIINENINDLESRYISKQITNLPKSKRQIFGQNCLHYIQMALNRSKVLIEGCLIALDNENDLLAMLATRAHFEVTGALAYLLKRLQSFYNGTIDFEKIDEDLFRLTLGSKDPGLPLAPDPINVMNLIDAADTLFQKISGIKGKTYRELYDFLSEICHPNSFGITKGSKVIDNGVIEYEKNKKLLENDLGFLNFLCITVEDFLMFYDNIFDLIKEGEELPKIIK